MKLTLEYDDIKIIVENAKDAPLDINEYYWMSRALAKALLKDVELVEKYFPYETNL